MFLGSPAVLSKPILIHNNLPIVSLDAFLTVSYTAVEMASRVLFSSKKPVHGLPLRSAHIIVYKHGTVQYILSVQVIGCYKKWILHRQTIYGINEKVMVFKIIVLKFKLKHAE
jgi:hypothetical protein